MRDQDFYDAVLLDDSARLSDLLGQLTDLTRQDAAVGALREAIQHNRQGIVEIYLRAGMSPNVRGNGDQTPLMWAADAGHCEIMRRLLDAGAEVEAADYRGWTALFYAVANQDFATVKLLVDAGANIRRRVSAAQGGTPLELARFKPVRIELPNGSGTVIGRSTVPSKDTVVAEYLKKKLAE